MKKIIQNEDTLPLIRDIFHTHGIGFCPDPEPKVLISSSGKSLLYYNYNPIGINFAKEFYFLTTPEDRDEVFTTYQQLLGQKQGKWVHVAVSVSEENADLFTRENGYSFLRNDPPLKRYPKSLDRVRFRQ